MFLFGLLLVACGGDKGEDSNSEKNQTNGDGIELGQKTLKVPYVAWARETVSTHLLAAILEEVGYTVELSQVEAGPMYASVANGSADFHTSAWLPATHASYWEKYEDD